MAFLVSFVSLKLGLGHMGARYPLAACGGYASFLLILRAAVAASRGSSGWDANPLDLLDVPSRSPRDSSSPSSEPGACEPLPDLPTGVELPFPDIDDAAIVLIPLVILGAGALGAFYVIYMAPVLLAELVLDVLIITVLARRYRHIEQPFWATGAIRRTLPAFVGVLLTVTVVGLLAAHFSPEADSIGDLVRRP